tara:strand:+ start:297 stop:437 length:141 start_codon:yes stop_codon:yes gene_type:complete
MATSPELQAKGEAARAHVQASFSPLAFGRQLEAFLLAAIGGRTHID